MSDGEIIESIRFAFVSNLYKLLTSAMGVTNVLHLWTSTSEVQMQSSQKGK